MSMAALRWARGVRGISSTQKLVLWALADMANDYAEAWPTAIGLAEDCCLSERAVREAFDAIEAAGLMTGTRATGRAARWVLHLDRSAPEPRSVPPAPSSATPAPRSGVRDAPAPRSATPAAASGVPAVDPGTSFRTTPERGSDPPRNVVPVTPERGSDRTLKNPHRTPSEPSTRAEPRAVVVPLPAWLPPDAWDAWCQHRVAKSRKGWTHAAAVRCVATLEKLRDAGDDPREVIDQSIAGGWTGLFPLKNRSNGRAAEKARPWWMEDMLRERH